MDKMAKVMKVARSGYYSYVKRLPSAQEQENIGLLEKIKVIHKAKRKVYGSPRIHAELKRYGEKCSRKRVAKLMSIHGIRAKMKCGFQKRKRCAVLTPSNLLSQRFEASKPNEIWLADITYIRTAEGWLYVAAILDLFSRKIVGLSMSNRMQTDLVKNALQQAVINRNPGRDLIHHSDRGSQYTSEDFKQVAASYKMRLSMNSGSCYDNAPMESFFHTLKTEHTYLIGYKTRKETKSDIFEFIEIFYNRQRSHSKLGYLSPYEFEKIYFEKQRLCS